MNNTTKSSVKRLLVLLTASLCLTLFAGCYTQLMRYQGETVQGREGGACDEGCPEEIAASSARHQICVWERDIFGYPEMRCYNTRYHSSWMYFHSTPWWYRSSFGWYDTRGCPPHYYFDSYSRTCRRYGHSYPPPNTGHGGGGGGRPPVSVEDRPRPAHRSGLADPAPRPEPPMFHGSSLKNLSPVGAPSPSSSTSSSTTTSTPVQKQPESGGLSKPQEEQKPPQPQAPAERQNGDDRPRPRGRGM
ncbi:MAG: hypothetical protein FWB85_08810 [Chitinispirillia bacterium]|nr:hypothetical protein [Chitinispirillia bacterium]